MKGRIAALLKQTPPDPAIVTGLLFAHGETVPTAGSSGYEIGCVFSHVDGAEGTALYVNEGSVESCTFNPVASLSAAQEALLGAVAGTVTASMAVVVDANKDIGDFRNLDGVNLDAGSSGVAGSVDVFPTTAAKGKFTLSCADQDADTIVTLKPAAMGQASVISIPDPGAATANVMLTDQANDNAPVTASSVELNVLDGVTPGTSAPSLGLVLDAGGDISAGPVILADMAEGSGASAAASLEHSVVRSGGLFHTKILIDLVGLNSGVPAGDIIGQADTANCHIGQILAAVNGTIVAGRITCLETPATGDNDIDLYAATEATGTEDTAISGLTATQLCNSGDLAAGTVVPLTAFPATTKYLYLVAGTGDLDATYSAGILLIELWGK